MTSIINKYGQMKIQVKPCTPGTSDSFLQTCGQTLQETNFWNPISFHHISLGCLPLFTTKHPSRYCRDVDLQTRIHLWFIHGGTPAHFLLAVCLAQCMKQGEKKKSVACSFLSFKSLRPLPLWTSEDDCLYYKRQWYPGHSTLDAKHIWNDW